MKLLPYLLALNLFFPMSSMAQDVDSPCDWGAPIAIPSEEISQPAYNGGGSVQDSPKIKGSIKALMNRVRQAIKKVEQDAEVLKEHKRKAMLKCRELKVKHPLCKEEAERINKAYEIELKKLLNKYLQDTAISRYYYEQFLSKKRPPFAFVVSDSKRRKNRIKTLKKNNINFNDSLNFATSCLIDALKFSCILSKVCPTNTCLDTIISDPLTQNCLCIPFCPSPDKNCGKYQYNPDSCTCICIECLPTSDCERDWNSEKQKCECKPKIGRVEAMRASIENSANLYRAMAKSQLDTCLLSFGTDGKNTFFTIGIDLESKTRCSAYLKLLNYEDGVYEMPPTYAKSIKTILSRLKDYVEHDYDVTFRIVGTADRAPMQGVYIGKDMRILRHYQISDDKSCVEKKDTDFKKNETIIDNPLLGLLRAYQFRKYIDNLFPNSQSKKYYSIPFKSYRGGSYRRAEIYIMVLGFNEKYYEMVQEVEQESYLKKFKDCDACDSYYWLNSCNKLSE